MFLDLKYRLSTDQYGLAVIEVTGRCTSSERGAVEAGCTRRYAMVTLPNSSGAVLKSLDGTVPRILWISPTTMPGTMYQCVKVDGRCNPFAYKQAAGPFAGYEILTYLIKYQEVGGVS